MSFPSTDSRSTLSQQSAECWFKWMSLLLLAFCQRDFPKEQGQCLSPYRVWRWAWGCLSPSSPITISDLDLQDATGAQHFCWLWMWFSAGSGARSCLVNRHHDQLRPSEGHQTKVVWLSCCFLTTAWTYPPGVFDTKKQGKPCLNWSQSWFYP